MELQNALAQIADIHRQMARTRVFRGYRAATTLLTGIGAVLAAVWQALAIADPASEPWRFANIWIAVAAASVIMVGTQIVRSYRLGDSPLQRELTLLAVEQFLPCLVIGGAVTFVLYETAASVMWMLPGLWSIFFGLGFFASRRLQPGAIVFVGAFYLLCGLVALMLGIRAFSPWVMGSVFGIGQTAAAIILYLKLERP